MNYNSEKSIVIFDGTCNLCNKSVQFILKHDKKERFLFTSLQSDVATNLLLQYANKKISLDSIILIEKDKTYEKSTAALRIAKQLSGGYRLLFGLMIIPKFIRDFIYDYIAKNRYKWFGKRDKCELFDNKYAHRFLS